MAVSVLHIEAGQYQFTTETNQPIAQGLDFSGTITGETKLQKDHYTIVAKAKQAKDLYFLQLVSKISSKKGTINNLDRLVATGAKSAPEIYEGFF